MPENPYNITPPDISFAGLPVCTNLEELEADIAIIGLHYTSPYPSVPTTAATQEAVQTAPEAIRYQSSVFNGHWNHYDFNFNEVLLANRQIKLVDCGDVDRQAKGAVQNPELITQAIRSILNRGTVPIAVGTDEGGFIPFARAYDGFDNICVVHIDAHIDWRDERHGEKEGYSSGMRRASEMPWVKAMAQVGLRGIGSARQREVDDALEFGSVFIPARQVHRQGIRACVDKIPEADHYLITMDIDALDTAIAPGVLYPSPGGLTFDEATGLVRGIAAKGPSAGVSLIEVRPERDSNGLTASTCAHLIVNFIGTLARTGHNGG